MEKKTIKEFLKPDWRKILLFGIFIFVMIAASIQSYAFIDGEEFGIPKPPLYDLLRPFPFWAMSMSLILPLAMMFVPFRSIGLSHIIWSGWIAWTIETIYFYLVSCFIFFGYERYIKKFSRNYWVVVIIISLTLSFVLGGIWNIPFLREQVMNLIGGTFTLLFYIYLLSCGSLLIYNKFKKVILKNEISRRTKI